MFKPFYDEGEPFTGVGLRVAFWPLDPPEPLDPPDIGYLCPIDTVDLPEPVPDGALYEPLAGDPENRPLNDLSGVTTSAVFGFPGDELTLTADGGDG